MIPSLLKEPASKKIWVKKTRLDRRLRANITTLLIIKKLRFPVNIKVRVNVQDKSAYKSQIFYQEGYFRSVQIYSDQNSSTTNLDLRKMLVTLNIFVK